MTWNVQKVTRTAPLSTCHIGRGLNIESATQTRLKVPGNCSLLDKAIFRDGVSARLRRQKNQAGVGFAIRYESPECQGTSMIHGIYRFKVTSDEIAWWKKSENLILIFSYFGNLENKTNDTCQFWIFEFFRHNELKILDKEVFENMTTWYFL